jgi:hypothetical protein
MAYDLKQEERGGLRHERIHAQQPDERSPRRDGLEKLHGAQGRDRTTDTAIFSRMLYQLSYLGAARARTTGSAGL